MYLNLNQIFRATSNFNESQYVDQDQIVNYKYATSNNFKKGTAANIARPMFWFTDTNGICPALILYSNPFQKDKEINPWRDVILQSEGIAFYNGDNKDPDRRPNENPINGSQSGNNKVENLINLYKSHDIEDRKKAPPVVLFEQVKVKNKVKGYRAFRGLGIIHQTHIRQQYQEGTGKVFSNYLFEIILFKLPHEGLNWEWINDRRTKGLDFNSIHDKAPPSWKQWINAGESSLNKVRQHILRYNISPPNEQKNELKDGHLKILKAIINHYKPNKQESKFEALASLAAEEFFGPNLYKRGWITPQTRDMGVDFIGRYDLRHPEIPAPSGSVLGTTALLVIGQAKCRNLDSGEVARDIARVASRLQRGQIGIFITTGFFQNSVQYEVILDNYPIILINGRHLADLIQLHLIKAGKSIEQVLLEQDEWYSSNISYAPAFTILHDLIPQTN